jgi:hypothetical protein
VGRLEGEPGRSPGGICLIGGRLEGVGEGSREDLPFGGRKEVDVDDPVRTLMPESVGSGGRGGPLRTGGKAGGKAVGTR